MYWGNQRAQAFQGSAFDSAGRYAGVWHLDEKPSGIPYAFPDAGPARNGARAMGVLSNPDSMPAIGEADGRIGGGVPLTGKDTYLMATRE